MAAKIYTAMTEIPFEPFNKKHLYLVFDADGDASTTNDQQVIRGGPSVGGDIKIEANFDMDESEDDYDPGEDYTDRHFTELNVGVQNPSAVWNAMVAAAEALGEEDSGYYYADLDYYLLSQNSNSVIATVLYQAGFSVEEAAPEYYGTGNQVALSDVPGHNTYLGTDGSDTWTIDISGKKRIVADQGGDDEYIIDLDGVDSGILTINETAEAASDDTLTLENVDPEDVGVFRSADGKHLIVIANGKAVAWVPDQYADNDPRLNAVTIVPAVGDPETIPLDDPEDIPFFAPQDLPDWVQGVMGPIEQAETSTPLVLDLAGTGINLAALGGEGSVYWNHSLGDFANASGWIAEGSGLLVIDLNEDGIINDHSELFGTATTDGFTILSAYDTNTDDAITSADDDWDDLLVWTDDNSDGHSQASELHTLDSLLITSINLNASLVSYDIAGNPITHESTFTIDGQTHDIVDAWFAYDTVNTVYVGDYTLDPDALFLPTLRGYGTLPDLHIAMSMDETLLGMVQEIAVADLAQLDTYQLDAKVRDVMLRWAGVDEVDPASRGSFIDARILEFLEAFMGRGYMTDWSTTDPGSAEANVLLGAWNNAFDAIRVRLTLQSGGAELFAEPPVYDPVSDTITGDYALDLTAIENASGAFSHQNAVESALFWKHILRTLHHIAGLDNLDQSDIDALDDIIQNDDPSGLLSFEAVTTAFEESAQMLNGDANGNLLLGGFGTDSAYGYAGNDVLIGGVGRDELYGGDGADTYQFGLGDGMRTGTGSLYYYYNQVKENLSEGTDKIVLGEGIAVEDVRLWTDQYGNMFIQYSEDDYIWVQGGQTSGASRVGEHLEQIVFDDATVWDLTQGLYLRDHDDSNNLYGSNYGDTILGEAGSDYLYGKGGNDILIGGVGRDEIYGGDGADTYQFGLGDGMRTGTGSQYYYYNQVNENLSEGTDKIVFDEGIAAEDVRLWTDQYGNMFIQYSVDDYVWVKGSQTANASRIGEHLEQIVFDDATTWDLTQGLYLRDHDNSNNIYGSNYGDTILGEAGGDYLYGKGGNDILIGGDGNDTLNGEDGNDTLDGGVGNDSLTGGAGDDLFIYSVGLDSVVDTGGADTLKFTDGVTVNDISFANVGAYNAKITVTASVDEVTVVNLRHGTASNHVERILFDDGFYADLPSYQSWLNGTSGNDVIAGNSNDNTLIGFAGNDDIDAGAGADHAHGGAGADDIHGDDGDDLLHGGDGDDVLYGDDGLDTLFGGAGADTFTFDSASAFNDIDIIKDFDAANDDDVIDLINVLSATAYDPQQDAITDWVEMTTVGDDTILKVDRDGTGGTYGFDQIATLEDVTGLTDEAALVSSGNLLAA